MLYLVRLFLLMRNLDKGLRYLRLHLFFYLQIGNAYRGVINSWSLNSSECNLSAIDLFGL